MGTVGRLSGQGSDGLTAGGAAARVIAAAVLAWLLQGGQAPASAGPFKVAIIGSRDFSNPRLLAAVREDYRRHIGTVVSGGADGGDRLGAKWARKNGIQTLIFEPDHKRYKHAYHHRNRLIVEAADFIIAFWNGHSTGTAYTVDYARRMSKPVRVVRY